MYYNKRIEKLFNIVNMLMLSGIAFAIITGFNSNMIPIVLSFVLDGYIILNLYNFLKLQKNDYALSCLGAFIVIILIQYTCI